MAVNSGSKSANAESAGIAVRNTRLVHLITGIENASFSLPIWILFFNRQLGLSVGIAIVLGMTRWASMALFELPTGSWADRFGRVRLYRFGQFFYALSFVPFLFTKNLFILFLAQIIGGLFGAMTSGALKPLVHDSHKLAKLPRNSYKRFVSTNAAIMYATRLCAGIAGAWLYTKYPYAPYALEAFVLFMAFVVSLGLVELRISKSTAKNNWQHIRQTLSFIADHRYLRNFFIIIIIYTLLSEAVWTLMQPFFEHRQVPEELFGVLFACIALFSILGSYVYRHLPDIFDGMTLRIWMTILTISGVLFFIVPGFWAIILGLCLVGLSFGFSSPNAHNVIQKNTNSSHQSTALSLYSLSGMIFYSIASVFVGFIADLYGIDVLLRVILVQAVIGLIIIFIISLLSKNYKSDIS